MTLPGNFNRGLDRPNFEMLAVYWPDGTPHWAAVERKLLELLTLTYQLEQGAQLPRQTMEYYMDANGDFFKDYAVRGKDGKGFDVPKTMEAVKAAFEEWIKLEKYGPQDYLDAAKEVIQKYGKIQKFTVDEKEQSGKVLKTKHIIQQVQIKLGMTDPDPADKAEAELASILAGEEFRMVSGPKGGLRIKDKHYDKGERPLAPQSKEYKAANPKS